MPVKDIHSWSLATSTELTQYYAPMAITPAEVIDVLNEACVRFTLVGLHGIGGWLREPRGTKDIDIVVAARGHKKAIKVLSAAFPHLQVADHDIVTRFLDPELGYVVIDVIKPKDPLFQEALKRTRWVESGERRYQIPTLEMALAMKFASMTSLNRADEDRYQDAHDFILLVKVNPTIDLDTLAKLGDLVYNGGGQEVVGYVHDIRAGKKISV